MYEDIFPSTRKPESTSFTRDQIPDIGAMDRAARLIHQSLEIASDMLKPGLCTLDIAKKVTSFLAAGGADPGIIVRISPEEVVWHGMPDGRIIRDGDIISVDIACSVRGWWADAARTLPVGEIDSERRHLLMSAFEGTKAVLSAMKPGEDGSTSSAVVRRLCEKRAVRLVGEAAGHGIGRRLHKYPSITYDGRLHTPLKSNSVYTVEPIFTSGDGRIRIADDGSAVTGDGAPSAHFEVTALLLEHGAHILGAPDWMERRPC